MLRASILPDLTNLNKIPQFIPIILSDYGEMSKFKIGQNPPPKLLDEWNVAKKSQFFKFLWPYLFMQAKNSLKNQNFYIFSLNTIIEDEFKTAPINLSK